MRRSSHVAAPLLAATALGMLAGCHSGPEMQRCVDRNNQVVNPALCSSGASTGSGYHFYYGGRGGYGFGSYATGGSTSPSAGHSYSSTSGTSRGGFGSSFSSGGHGSGGAGE